MNENAVRTDNRPMFSFKLTKLPKMKYGDEPVRNAVKPTILITPNVLIVN